MCGIHHVEGLMFFRIMETQTEKLYKDDTGLSLGL